MTITMPRGDIRPVSFNVGNTDGSELDIEFDEIYFTVKNSYNKRDFLIQKRLSTDDIFKTGANTYQFVIEAADTDNLSYGHYVFDIELVKNPDIKQTFIGDFILTNEVTHAENED